VPPTLAPSVHSRACDRLTVSGRGSPPRAPNSLHLKHCFVVFKTCKWQGRPALSRCCCSRMPWLPRGPEGRRGVNLRPRLFESAIGSRARSDPMATVYGTSAIGSHARPVSVWRHQCIDRVHAIGSHARPVQASHQVCDQIAYSRAQHTTPHHTTLARECAPGGMDGC
jgi:hypothetical protein